MKLLTKTAIATVMAMSTLGAVNAKTLDFIPGVTSPNVNVTVQEGVATLFGVVDTHSERKLAERHVAKLEGVDRVINLVTHQ